MITNCIRIASGSIADFVHDASRLTDLGRASISQDYLTGKISLLKTSREKRRFRLQRSPLGITEELFLEIVDNILLDERMYLSNAKISNDWLKSILMGFRCYHLVGHLYEEMQ